MQSYEKKCKQQKTVNNGINFAKKHFFCNFANQSKLNEVK